MHATADSLMQSKLIICRLCAACRYQSGDVTIQDAHQLIIQKLVHTSKQMQADLAKVKLPNVQRIIIVSTASCLFNTSILNAMLKQQTRMAYHAIQMLSVE